jgi:hypothetical protein
MATIPTISAQIQALAASSQHLREMAKQPLPVLDVDLYLRPVPGGCTALSVNPQRRPQQGTSCRWSTITEVEQLRAARDRTLASRTGETRVTPEKALQSFLIRDAIQNKGWMKSITAACQERPKLRFLADEASFRDATGKKTVCDLLAVRIDGDIGVPVAIELKSARNLKRLTEQVCATARLMEKYRSDFQMLAEACWGSPIRLAERAECWIVWPTAGADRHGDLDPRDGKCRAENVRLVTYSGEPGKELHLQAASRIQP